MSLIRKAFKRLHYPIDVIAQCVRWYLTYALSLRNLEDMMTERGVIVDHSTLHRWVASEGATTLLLRFNDNIGRFSDIPTVLHSVSVVLPVQESMKNLGAVTEWPVNWG